METCPLCKSPIQFTEVWVQETPFGTVFDFRCRDGHLVQYLTRKSCWQILTLTEDGDEIYGLECDENFRLLRIRNWNYVDSSCLDLEGTGVEREE